MYRCLFLPVLQSIHFSAFLMFNKLLLQLLWKPFEYRTVTKTLLHYKKHMSVLFSRKISQFTSGYHIQGDLGEE